jgi:hypothetical protein
MATTFVDEYLVKLGSAVDQSGMQRFYQALREAKQISDVSATGIAGAFFKAQTEIVGGFAAIGVAAVGLIDKVAMADQSYRLFALHMYMTKDAARSLKVATDALGASMEDITWDPELNARFHQLVKDQQAMAPGGDFDGQMKKIRDIRFEFTRMEVEGQYLAMNAVNSFLGALGMGPDTLLSKLQTMNERITHNIPEITAKVMGVVAPIWKDLKEVFLATGDAIKATAGAFINLVGLFSSDTSLQGTEVSLDKVALALTKVIHGFAGFVEVIATVETMLAHIISSLTMLFHGDLKGSNAESDMAYHAFTSLTGISEVPPAGEVGGNAGSAAASSRPTGASTVNVGRVIRRYAEKLGVDPNMALALAQAESGGQQYDSAGNLKMGVGSDGKPSSATGVFQLIDKTARKLGVNSHDTDQNIKGGITYFKQLLDQYGDPALAIAAYHDGPGKMAQIQARKATLSRDGQAEVAQVMRGAGYKGDVQIGSIVVHVTGPGHTNEKVADVIVAKMRETDGKKTQRWQAQVGDMNYGY